MLRLWLCFRNGCVQRKTSQICKTFRLLCQIKSRFTQVTELFVMMFKIRLQFCAPPIKIWTGRWVRLWAPPLLRRLVWRWQITLGLAQFSARLVEMDGGVLHLWNKQATLLQIATAPLLCSRRRLIIWAPSRITLVSTLNYGSSTSNWQRFFFCFF